MNNRGFFGTIRILGVRIDNFSTEGMKEKIENILSSDSEKNFVTTLNPEILLRAYRNKDYRDILNGADLNICDGFGLKLITFLRKTPLRARFAGVDLVDFILENTNRKKSKVLVIVAGDSLSDPAEIEQSISAKYPDLEVKSEYLSAVQSNFSDDIIRSAEIVFVNFGAPEQEKFIHKNREKFPEAKILAGVGGTFDFLTGKIKRAPKWMRNLGLEWLWRLIQEPKRLTRIINATIIFPLAVLTSRD